MPVCELNSSGTFTATNTFGPNGLISRNAGGTADYYTFDPQGNTSQIYINTAWGASNPYVDDAYGNLDAGTSNPPFDGFGAQFGNYHDATTGWYLMGHRFYAAGQGRFVNRDPIGYGGGINLYGYSDDDPMNEVDPSGFGPSGNTGPIQVTPPPAMPITLANLANPKLPCPMAWLGLPTLSAIQRHHPFAQFLGGPEDQELVGYEIPTHQELHIDLAKYLRNIKNDTGQDMSPRRGNPGADIRANFPPDEREQAQRDFYNSPDGSKYPEAAESFNRQFPGSRAAGGVAAEDAANSILTTMLHSLL